MHSQLSETLINNQDPNENDSEDTETKKTSTIPTFMMQILPDNYITGGINALNSKQREIFNVFYKWAKESVKCNEHNVEPIHIFLSDSGGTGKSHLVKVMYNAISKTLRYHCKDPEKPGVLLFALQKYQQ